MEDPLVFALSAEVVQVLEKSFKRFSIVWSTRKYEHPLSENQQSDMKNSITQCIDNGHADSLFNKILIRVDDFIVDNVVTNFDSLRSPEEYLNLCEQFENYIRTVETWLVEILEPLEIEFAVLRRPLVCATIRQRSRKAFYEEIIAVLRDACFQRVKILRVAHPSHAQWAYIAAYNSNRSKLIRILYEFMDENTVEDTWVTQYSDGILIYIQNKVEELLEDIGERDFAALATTCVMRESKFFEKDCRIDSSRGDSFSKDLFDVVCKEYHERIRDGAFKTPADLLTASDFDFDPKLISDLAEMHCSSGNYGTEFLMNLKRDIKAKCGEWVENQMIIVEESSKPLENSTRLLEQLRNYQDLLANRLHSSMLASKTKEKITPILQDLVYGNVFKQISNQSITAKIEEDGELFVKHLCSVQDNGEDEVADLDFLCKFFTNLANQKKFMDGLKNFLTQQISAGKIANYDKIAWFLQKEEIIPYVSISLHDLLKDIAVSKRSVSSFLAKWNAYASRSSSLQRLPTLGETTLVLKEQGWPVFENNLLVRPESILQLHKSYEEHIKERLQPEQRIKAVNALSFVTIKTHLFSGARDFIRIRLSVYQLSVLNMFHSTNEVFMKDMYNEMIRRDVTDSSERKSAEQVVNLVIMSLAKPFPLIKIFSRGAGVSDADLVKLNKEFVFDEKFVQLTPPVLTREKTTYKKKEVPIPRKRNVMREKVAEMIIRTKLRNGRIREEELVLRALERAKKHNVEREDIELAIASMIERKLVKRNEEDNSVLELIPQEDD